MRLQQDAGAYALPGPGDRSAQRYTLRRGMRTGVERRERVRWHSSGASWPATPQRRWRLLQLHWSGQRQQPFRCSQALKLLNALFTNHNVAQNTSCPTKWNYQIMPNTFRNRNPEIRGGITNFRFDLVGVRQARTVVQRLGDARGPQWQATAVDPLPQKVNLISK